MPRTAEETKEKSRKKFTRWYDRNREEHNAKRRKAYAEDPERRRKAREAAKLYRESNASVDVSKPIKTADGTKLYRSAHVAKMIGRSAETLRTWRRTGWVPEMERPILYTMGQVKLLGKLAKVVEDHRYDSDYDERIQKVVAEVFEKWQ